MNDGKRKIRSKGKWTKGSSQKAPPLTLETTKAEIRDCPYHHHKGITLIQVTRDQTMVVEEDEAKAPHGDQNKLSLFTLK